MWSCALRFAAVLRQPDSLVTSLHSMRNGSLLNICQPRKILGNSITFNKSYVLQVDPNLPCSTPKIILGKQSVNQRSFQEDWLLELAVNFDQSWQSYKNKKAFSKNLPISRLTLLISWFLTTFISYVLSFQIQFPLHLSLCYSQECFHLSRLCSLSF